MVVTIKDIIIRVIKTIIVTRVLYNMNINVFVIMHSCPKHSTNSYHQ